MTGNTAPFVQEEIEPTLLLIVQRRGVATEVETIEGRVTGDERALETGNGLTDLGDGDLGASLPEDGLESLRIIRIRANNLKNRIMIFQTAFNGIDEGLMGLSFERGLSSIPKQGCHVGRIDDCWRVTGSSQSIDADRNTLRTIGKSHPRIMAGHASHLARGAEAFIVKQLVSKGDLFGSLRIVRGYGNHGQPKGWIRQGRATDHQRHGAETYLVSHPSYPPLIHIVFGFQQLYSKPKRELGVGNTEWIDRASRSSNVA